MNEIKIGDVVCLIFDKSKRFLVESPMSNSTHKIIVSYFSDYYKGIVQCEIEKRYLTKISDDNESLQE